MNGTGGNMSVEETLRDFWKTRPRRPRRGRKIAGVATAIGNRYGIDPVLVRVAFVVFAIYGGLGILLYLLAVLFFPQEGDTGSPAGALLGRGSSSTSALATVLVALMVLPLSGLLLALHVWSAMMIAALGAGLYVLHKNRGTHRQPTPTGPVVVSTPMTSDNGFQGTEFRTETLRKPGQQETETMTTDQQSTGQEKPVTAEHAQESPPAWDPLGAAPFAWDLPEPAAAPVDDEIEPQPQPRSKITAVTVAVSIIVAGVMGLGVMDGWAADHVAAGAVTAVLAAGLLVGAFRRGGKGLVLLAVPAIAATVTLANDASWRDYQRDYPENFGYDGYTDTRSNYYGTQTWTPRSWEELRRGSEIGTSAGTSGNPSFFLQRGTARLDLSQLPPLASGESTQINARVDYGSLYVTLPKNGIDVEVSCAAEDSGTVNCLDQTGRGPKVRRTARSAGDDNTTGGGQITLYASVADGKVEVTR
ncbi:PspC domain-containing protein [Allokutzneria sp. A3M-2-11 16]|uniref:PspC domain-containing protein n=1 Tax=Allokutzneria sp. A3M-2-11 16 TaxID=2962043 RepID=UPI0020B6798F|nr:PspC domain-containing protein [Allokutzneria sp. A3M-2-11 16]MCP3798804.1 PspC domain-containing protein [Allokutzneria sp. A3M-2-11 16]